MLIFLLPGGLSSNTGRQQGGEGICHGLKKPEGIGGCGAFGRHHTTTRAALL